MQFQLLTNEFNNMKQLSDRFVRRKQIEDIYPYRFAR